jgi:hypothetical protein
MNLSLAVDPYQVNPRHLRESYSFITFHDDFIISGLAYRRDSGNKPPYVYPTSVHQTSRLGGYKNSVLIFLQVGEDLETREFPFPGLGGEYT